MKSFGKISKCRKKKIDKINSVKEEIQLTQWGELQPKMKMKRKTINVHNDLLCDLSMYIKHTTESNLRLK